MTTIAEPITIATRYGQLLPGDTVLGKHSGSQYVITAVDPLDNGLVRVATADREWEIDPGLRCRRVLVTIPCDNCRGTGQYMWGPVVNGVPTHVGPCFRCDSTGEQTPQRQIKNRVYDNNRRLY